MEALIGHVVDFRLEEKSANVDSWHRGRATTSHFFTKEQVYYAVTHQDRFLRSVGEVYVPIKFPFNLTPAVPIDIKTAFQIYNVRPYIFCPQCSTKLMGSETECGKCGSKVRPRRYYIQYGAEEWLMPGSSFRFVMYGDDLPRIGEGTPIFIGKKRGSAKITGVSASEVESSTELSFHSVFSIQLSPDEFSRYRDQMRTINLRYRTARYLIVSCTTDTMLRIGDYLLPRFDD